MILKEFANVFKGLTMGTVAATGTTNADAAALTTQVTSVTGADAAKGVILPAAGDVGEVFLIENTAAAVLKVYPDSGSQINSLTATTGAYSVAASATVFLVRASSTKLIAVGKF